MNGLQQALETWTPRQLRLAFMNQVWSAKMDLTEGTRSGVDTVEETFNVSRSADYQEIGTDILNGHCRTSSAT